MSIDPFLTGVFYAKISSLSRPVPRISEAAAIKEQKEGAEGPGTEHTQEYGKRNRPSGGWADIRGEMKEHGEETHCYSEENEKA